MRRAAAAVAILAAMVAGSARHTATAPPTRRWTQPATLAGLSAVRMFPPRAARSQPRRRPDPEPLVDASIPVLVPDRQPAVQPHRSTGHISPMRSAASSGAWACVRRHESGGNYADKRNPTYRGAWQFDRRTWASVGGRGDPADAPPAEQDMRAAMLQAARGWSPWPVTSRLCGLR